MKKVLLLILLSFFTVVVFVVTHELGVYFAQNCLNVSKSSLHWGITLNYAFYVFILFSILFSYIQLYTKGRMKIISSIGLCILYTSLFVSNITYTPYRTAFLLLCIYVACFTASLFVYLKNKSR